jgi:cephalosporin-C deacetylase
MAEDFDAYWSAVDAELARWPAAPEVESLPIRSTEFASVSTVRLTSIGPYRIFAYLSVPTGRGPHAAVLEVPGYGSVNHVPAYELRQRYVVLTLMHRGQRMAHQPFAAEYPGLLTLGIEQPLEYVYRGIVADCLRGAEFVFEHPAVDPRRVGITGDDVALITAARRPRFAAVQASALLFYRLLEACAVTDAYPIEEINDLLRHAPPGTLDAIGRTLAFFDPLEHARSVRAPTLLSVTDTGALGGPEWLAPLARQLGKHAELYQLTHEGRTDTTWVDNWLTGRLS